ncbi:TPA: hypothetical protein G9F27_005573 [Salmonella enterica]|uniref:Uncharacterized protein n=1 Tax=Salmonella enterica TaxID=28901 RepID=A0A743PHW9_SALER|nr:hypothetical protein [Salmonella enterica]
MRYILLIIAIMGGLFTFNVYADEGKQCSLTAVRENGQYLYGYSDGLYAHKDFYGCDYVAPANKTVLYFPDYVQSIWIPTGTPYKKPDNLPSDIKPVFTAQQCLERPVLYNHGMKYYYTSYGEQYAFFEGCEYKAIKNGLVNLPEPLVADWNPIGKPLPSPADAKLTSSSSDSVLAPAPVPAPASVPAPAPAPAPAPGSCPALKVPFQFDMFLTHFVPTNNSGSPTDRSPVLDIHGCSYLITFYSCPANADPSHSGSFCTANSVVLLSDDGNINSPIANTDWKDTQFDRYCAQAGKCNSKGEPINLSDWLKFKDKDDAEHEKPGDDTGLFDGSDSDTGVTDGAADGSVDGSSSGSSTPSPSAPDAPVFDFPVFDSADFSELIKAFNSCKAALPSGSDTDPIYVSAYNNAANVCNSILDKAKSLAPAGEMISPSDEHHQFYYKKSSGVMYSCMRDSGYYGRDVRGTVVSSVSHIALRNPNLLGLNYSSGGTDSNYPSELCGSVYDDYVSSLNKSPVSSGSSDSVSSGSSGSLSDKPLRADSADGSLVALPGNGHAASGDDGNGDVVAAINAFHADANKNHEETMNNFDISDGAVEGIKNGLASDVNELISSTRKEISDSYDAGVSELKSIFGDIDSYIPDIKLTFDLPTQFIAGIQGHCVPLVFDFNITLVGLPFYHLHAEGVQACKLYDLYIRSIVEYMFYFITALACRRIFTRAAEFISSN